MKPTMAQMVRQAKTMLLDGVDYQDVMNDILFTFPALSADNDEDFELVTSAVAKAKNQLHLGAR